MDDGITIEREGVLWYSWRAYGTLRRGMRAGSIFIMPGHPTTVGEGAACTRWGARRKARRALRRWT